MERKCDASLEKAVLNKSADNSECRIFLGAMQKEDKGVQSWRCRLQKCIDKRDEKCRSDMAKQCFGEVVVNATVCTYNYIKVYMYNIFINIQDTILMMHL